MRNQKRKGRNVSVSHGWWESFRKRHPNIILRTASPLSHVRTVGSNPIILSRYFDLLEITLQENELHRFLLVVEQRTRKLQPQETNLT